MRTAKEVIQITEEIQKETFNVEGWSDNYVQWIDEFSGKLINDHNYKAELFMRSGLHDSLDKELRKTGSIETLDDLRNYKPEEALEKVNALPEWIKRGLLDFIDKKRKI